MAEINAEPMVRRDPDPMNLTWGYPEFVKKKNPNLWYLGPHIECERLSNTSRPADALVTWEDGPYIFALRKRNGDNANDESLPEAELAQFKLNSRATYVIGDAAFCKVKIIEHEAQKQEHELVSFVKELAPEIPLAETIHGWKDDKHLWHISRRVPGETLRNAWLGLTDEQKENIADQVAQCAHSLAKSKSSERIEGALGGPYRPNWFLFLSPKGMDSDEAKTFFSPIPDSDSPFMLVHGDLTPLNIIVKDGRLAGIIDWEFLGYEPRFWLATEPAGTTVYWFGPSLYKGHWENNVWGDLLSKKLVDLGYPSHIHTWSPWARKKREIELRNTSYPNAEFSWDSEGHLHIHNPQNE